MIRRTFMRKKLLRTSLFTYEFEADHLIIIINAENGFKE